MNICCGKCWRAYNFRQEKSLEYHKQSWMGYSEWESGKQKCQERHVCQRPIPLDLYKKQIFYQQKA